MKKEHSHMHTLDAIEAAAYRDMFAAAPRELAKNLGLQIHEVAGATLLVASAIPSPIFNRVIGLGNTQSATLEDLNEIINVYRQSGMSNWWLHHTPGAKPNSLIEMLTANGFRQPERSHWAKMVRDNAAPPEVSTQLDLRLIRSDEAQTFGETLCIAFDIPTAWASWFAALTHRDNWHAVGASADDTIIGGGLLHIQGRNAWLGAGGVLPEARGKHVHRALMAMRIKLAIDAGCHEMVTETGEPFGDEPNPSLRNMYACGFNKLFSRANYQIPG
jgi:GNAT superfamily N-acetyltransferase